MTSRPRGNEAPGHAGASERWERESRGTGAPSGRRRDAPGHGTSFVSTVRGSVNAAPLNTSMPTDQINVPAATSPGCASPKAVRSTAAMAPDSAASTRLPKSQRSRRGSTWNSDAAKPSFSNPEHDARAALPPPVAALPQRNRHRRLAGCFSVRNDGRGGRIRHQGRLLLRVPSATRHGGAPGQGAGRRRQQQTAHGFGAFERHWLPPSFTLHSQRNQRAASQPSPAHQIRTSHGSQAYGSGWSSATARNQSNAGRAGETNVSHSTSGGNGTS